MTVYAFAIDNFGRPADEVEGLMDLAKTKLLELAQKGFVRLLTGDLTNAVNCYKSTASECTSLASEISFRSMSNKLAIKSKLSLLTILRS